MRDDGGYVKCDIPSARVIEDVMLYVRLCTPMQRGRLICSILRSLSDMSNCGSSHMKGYDGGVVGV